jgi:hypothetical protein
VKTLLAPGLPLAAIALPKERQKLCQEVDGMSVVCWKWLKITPKCEPRHISKTIHGRYVRRRENLARNIVRDSGRQSAKNVTQYVTM